MGGLKNLLIKKIKDFLIGNKVLFPIALKMHSFYYGLFSKKFHQISHFTLYDRYPHLFAFAKSYFEKKNHKSVNILSYGCSTGEECFSINEYIKNANIIGVDSSLKVLAKAREHNTHSNIRFLESTPENIHKNGPYDLIFAMAVFCRWPSSNYYKDISHLYPFKRFEENITDLSEYLKKDGLLIINNTNFLLADTEVYAQYEALETPDGVEADVVPKFSKENKWLGLLDKSEVIFRKIK